MSDTTFTEDEILQIDEIDAALRIRVSEIFH